MEALCANAVSLRQSSPRFLSEVSKLVNASLNIAEPAVMADAVSPARDPGISPSPKSYQVFASKNPKSRSRTSRATTGKKAERKRRGAVLVVDDVPDVTEMIGLLLKHAGYDVATADSARSALQLARITNFDIVISDIGMPEMNGYELATALRRLTEYNKTPMIAVTGYSEYDDRGRAVSAGFNVHLTKPIEPTQLLNLMNELLPTPESGTDH